MSDVGIDVGDRIAHWRKAKGLSRPDFAKAVGVTVAAVYQWEGTETIEKVPPSFASIEKIVEAFDITMARFFGPLPRIAAKAS